jgi:hypothetical protein
MTAEVSVAQHRAKSSLILAGAALTTSILALSAPRFGMLATVVAGVMFCILAERLTRALYHHFHIHGVAAMASRLLVLVLALAVGIAPSVGRPYGEFPTDADEVWVAAILIAFLAGSAILGAVMPLRDDTRRTVVERLRQSGLIIQQESFDAMAQQQTPTWVERWAIGAILACYSVVLGTAFWVAQAVQIVFLALTGLFLLVGFLGTARRLMAPRDALALYGRLDSIASSGLSQVFSTLRLDLVVQVFFASSWVATMSFAMLVAVAMRPWPEGAVLLTVCGPFALAQLHLVGMLLRKFPSLTSEGGQEASEQADIGLAHLGFFIFGSTALPLGWAARLTDSDWVALGAGAAFAIGGVGYWMAHIFWRGGPAYRWLSGRLPWDVVFLSGLWLPPTSGLAVQGLSGAAGGALTAVVAVLLVRYPSIRRTVVRLSASPTRPLRSHAARFLLGWLPVILIYLLVALIMLIVGWRWTGLTLIGLFLLWFLAFPVRCEVQEMRGGSKEEVA